MIKASIKELSVENAKELVKGSEMTLYENHYGRVWKKVREEHGNIILEFESGTRGKLVCESDIKFNGCVSTEGYFCDILWLEIKPEGLEGAMKLI